MEALDSAWDVSRNAEIGTRLALGQGVTVPEGSTPTSPQRVHGRLRGISAPAHAAIRPRSASLPRCREESTVFRHNPSQFRTYSIDEVPSAPITYPLTLPTVVDFRWRGCRRARYKAGMQRLGIDEARHQGARLRHQTGSDRDPSEVERHCTALAAKRAYDKAGVGPADISVAEVHDATAMGEIIQIENLGFCDFGDGGIISERGETALGGRIPVNPSGGLESKGHPVGATGIGQVHELVTQLRGEAGARQVEGARIALSENGGGLQGIEEAVACITILGR